VVPGHQARRGSVPPGLGAVAGRAAWTRLKMGGLPVRNGGFV